MCPQHDPDAAGNEAVLARMTEPLAGFYRAFLSGDVDGMVAPLHPLVRLRFPSYPTLVGIAGALDFFRFQETVFSAITFELLDVLMDEAGAAVVWRETGVTAAGIDWKADGADVFTVADGLIFAIHVGGDGRGLVTDLPRYRPGWQTLALKEESS
jgi:ketosteroid isomerase-like protein